LTFPIILIRLMNIDREPEASSIVVAGGSRDA
jgi:hypothetical protein